MAAQHLLIWSASPDQLSQFLSLKKKAIFSVTSCLVTSQAAEANFQTNNFSGEAAINTNTVISIKNWIMITDYFIPK